MNDQYFFKIGHCNMPKNNLDREILKFAAALSGTLIASGNLDGFCEDLKEKVDQLHTEHPRCKKIYLSITDYSQSGDFGIDCGSTTAHIYKVKQHYPS